MANPNGDSAPSRAAQEGGIPVAPVPVSTQVKPMRMPDGEGRVVLFFQTPQGMNAFFISVEHARKLIEQLSTSAAAAAAGLVLPE